jgi:hypothetical protein
MDSNTPNIRTCSTSVTLPVKISEMHRNFILSHRVLSPPTLSFHQQGTFIRARHHSHDQALAEVDMGRTHSRHRGARTWAESATARLPPPAYVFSWCCNKCCGVTDDMWHFPSANVATLVWRCLRLWFINVPMIRHFEMIVSFIL